MCLSLPARRRSGRWRGSTLYGRRGKAALLAEPLLQDRDLCVVRMAIVFGFIEPSQEAQPVYSATDEACSRLGRRRSVAPAFLGLRPDRGHGFDLRGAHPAAFSEIQKAHQAQLIIGAFPQGRLFCACLPEMNEISFALFDNWCCSISLSGSGKEYLCEHSRVSISMGTRSCRQPSRRKIMLADGHPRHPHQMTALPSAPTPARPRGDHVTPARQLLDRNDREQSGLPVVVSTLRLTLELGPRGSLRFPIGHGYHQREPQYENNDLQNRRHELRRMRQHHQEPR